MVDGVKSIGRVFGVAIGLVGVGFVVRELIRNWDDVSAAVSGADPLLLLAAFLVGLVSMAAIGLAWRRCLSTMEVARPALTVLRAYFVGQLGKYVPGGIWPVVGRAEMARREGIGGAAAYGSTVLSMVLTYLAAALVAMSALLIGAGGDGQSSWWPALVLLVLGVIALHPIPAERALRLLRRFGRRELKLEVPSWGTSISLLLRHVPAWLGISAATWLVASTLDSGTPTFQNLVYATTLSWLLGFIAVGVPGGIGVREAVFIAAAGSVSSPGVAAAVAVVARALFIAVDLAGAGLATMAIGMRREPTVQRSGDSTLTED